MRPSGITIDRFSTVYLCSPGQDAGQRMRDRLDAVARRSIANHIESLSAPLLQQDDGAVWLIRRLEIDCTINAGWDDDDIARAWAKKMVSALGAELADGGTANALRFDNAAAYLARFVADLASGEAWSKWYYRRFAGLAALPSSNAIRSALVDAQSIGAAVLRILTAAERDRVLDALSPDDALLVLRMCASLDERYSLEEAAAMVASCEQAASRYAPADPRWALAVFMAASGEGDSGGSTLVGVIAAHAARSLLTDHQSGTSKPPQAIPTWVEALDGLETLMRLPHASPASQGIAGEEQEETRHTSFGGGFLLLPLLFDLRLEDWLGDSSRIADVPLAQVFRALLLGKCLGGVRCMHFLRDPLWQELLGLPANVDWHEVASGLSRLGAPTRRTLRSGLSVHAAEHGGEAVHNRIVRRGRHLWRISHDDLGYWHGLIPVRGGDDIEDTDCDLEYLAGPHELPLGLAWNALLSLAAQQLLRRFARRLPGFGLSHFPYLHANFLAISARVHREGESYVVRLSRPPLALMLNITGMTRTRYDLPWHAGRSCALYAEET